MPSCAPIALITGAARRIGAVIAHDLAKAGWDIAIHYHHAKAEVEFLLADIHARGRRAIAIQADLSDEAAVKALFPQLEAQLGMATCLINNASFFKNDTLATQSRTSWDKHMEVNLRAPIVLMQDFAAQLPEGTIGNVINILDYAVWSLPQHFFSYSISKSALWTATQSLAVTLAPRIRVNAIGPGPALANSRQTNESFSNAWHKTPLGISSSPEEIARVVQFILATPSMTGQMIALDGGRHLERAAYT